MRRKFYQARLVNSIDEPLAAAGGKRHRQHNRFTYLSNCRIPLFERSVRLSQVQRHNDRLPFRWPDDGRNRPRPETTSPGSISNNPALWYSRPKKPVRNLVAREPITQLLSGLLG